jgi:hypothetical protein
LQKIDSSAVDQLADCGQCSRHGVVYVDQFQVCPYHPHHHPLQHATLRPEIDAATGQPLLPATHVMSRLPCGGVDGLATCPMMTSSLTLCSRHRGDEYGVGDETTSSHPVSGHVHGLAASPTSATIQTSLPVAESNELDLIRNSLYQDALRTRRDVIGHVSCWTHAKCPCAVDTAPANAISQSAL